MYLTLNYSQLTTKDKVVANSASSGELLLYGPHYVVSGTRDNPPPEIT